MKPKVVQVSNCARIVNGDDDETLYQLWQATKNLKGPYRIVPLIKTGDSDRYMIEVQ